MRTKTLLLTAAVSAAGIASSMAQVFSVNAVGYVNVSVKPGFQLIANPLNASDNKISALIPSAPDGTTLYKFDSASGSYSINTFLFGAWSTPDQTLVPGEGAFILNPDTNPLPLTFVGEVMQGDLSNPIPKGFSIKSSQVPQAGALSGDLKFPATEGDTVYKYNTTSKGYDIYSYLFGSWSPNDPAVDVGESVFVNKVDSTPWTRSFNVNTP